MTTDRMVAWLRQTMDAAQADAEAATASPWHVSEHKYDEDFEAQIGSWPEGADIAGHGWEGGGVDTMATARHMVRHQPAAVLRRIAAERELLTLHQNDAGKCDECSQGYELQDWGPDYPCTTVRLIAKAWGWTEEPT